MHHIAQHHMSIYQQIIIENDVAIYVQCWTPQENNIEDQHCNISVLIKVISLVLMS